MSFTLLTTLTSPLTGCGEGDPPPPVEPLLMDLGLTPDEGLELPPPTPPTPPPPVCGDHVVEGDEACDDGNTTDGDGCDARCELERCGNGRLQFGERCDEGARNSDVAPNACRSDCTPARCGDGVTDRFESCDDGNLIETDACHVNCTSASCGDGVVREDLSEGELGFERCDDGALNSDSRANACRTNCTPARCGDGVRDAGEECDLGELNSSELGSGASCRADCLRPRCGDGVADERPACQAAVEPPPLCGNGQLDEGEACDLGAENTNEPAPEGEREVGAQTCRQSCELARCGDGVRDLGEACDDGNTLTEACLYGERACEVCDARCELVAGEVSYCGDGELSARELCDDGNDVSDDGCSNDCRPAGLRCGNGQLDEGETCDDGNVRDGDGCDFECHSECGNGRLDLGERCDEGELNQQGRCDLACTEGRALLLMGEQRTLGALPIAARNESDEPLYPTGARLALYHDELLFQVDAPSTLKVCLTLPTSDEPMPLGTLKLALERVASLGDGERLTLNFVEPTPSEDTWFSPNEHGCLTFGEDATEATGELANALPSAGAYRLKVGVADELRPLVESEASAQLTALGVLQRRGAELRYGLNSLLSQALTPSEPAQGRALEGGDDLFKLSLSEPSYVSLRVSHDGLGACPEREGLSRPQLTVLHDQEGSPGALFAQAHRYAAGELQSCVSLMSEQPWPAGEYWVKVSPEGDSPTGDYRLDAHTLVACEPESDPEGCPSPTLTPLTPRLLVRASSTFIEQLGARPLEPAEGDLTALREVGRRYDFVVPSLEGANTADKQHLSAALSGCAEGAHLKLSLWSLDELGALARQVASATALPLGETLSEGEACQRLEASLSPGRYALLTRHASLTELTSPSTPAQERALTLSATLPYQLDVEREQPLGVGGSLSAPFAVAPARDAPLQAPVVGGLIEGQERFSLSLLAPQRVELSLEVEGACELNATHPSLPVSAPFSAPFSPSLVLSLAQGEGAELNLALTPNAPMSVEQLELSLERQGARLISHNLTSCGGDLTLFLPSGEHSLSLSPRLDVSALANTAHDPISEPDARAISPSSALPSYTLAVSLPARCGNGLVEGSEACDDGNTDELDHCTSRCERRAVCGDGVLERALGERCDDGNLTPFDGCSPECARCGDDEVTGRESCEPSLHGELCDAYCTFKSAAIGLASFEREGEAIAAGERDRFSFTLREAGWLTARTLGCEPSTPGAPRRFDTTLTLLDEAGLLLLKSDDLNNSACAELSYYSPTEREAELVVESARFNEVLGYGLSVRQRVELLLDTNGLCVRSPKPNLTPLEPIEACEGGDHVELSGALNSALAENHTIRLISQGESLLRYSLSAGEGPCPARAWLAGRFDESGAPIALELTPTEGDPTSCGALEVRPDLASQLELTLEASAEGDTRYTLSVEVVRNAEGSCGNGLLDLGEECDLGELNSDSEPGAGVASGVCRTDCRLPYCGDGVIDRGEACDDGNHDNGDACLNSCEPARCGDGVVYVGVEGCDDGDTSNEDACTNACELAVCGDGYVQAGEVCDDGNTNNSDGCVDACQLVQYRCDSGQYLPNLSDCPAPEPVPVCGNGAIESGEQCDDRNTRSDDGCDASCQRERVIVSTGLYRDIHDDAHASALTRYELNVDGPSRLLAQTSAVNGETSCAASAPASGSALSTLDTLLNVYEVDAEGHVSRLIASADDITDATGAVSSLCSRLELTLYQAGRYVIEVAFYGQEPLTSYQLDTQLTRDLTSGERLRGRLRAGESDVYELTLFDHPKRVFSLITSHPSELTLEVLDRPYERAQEPTAQSPTEAITAAITSSDATLTSTRDIPQGALYDPFSAGEPREPLERAYVRVTRSQANASGELLYTISTARRCGDGVLNLTTERRILSEREECDDGNLSDGDGCSAYCRIERNLCGNGLLESGERCDPGHLLTNPLTPPGFANTLGVATGNERYEMSHSALVYFKLPPQDAPLDYYLPFVIDTTALNFEGVSPDQKKRLSFSLQRDEFDSNTGSVSTYGIAERIREAFPGLIEAWGRDTELSLIIKAGRSSGDVQVLSPEGSPWRVAPSKPLCDTLCTPTRSRLSSPLPLTTGGFQRLYGSVDEGGRDSYLLDLDELSFVELYTRGCAGDGERPPQDTSLSLYRVEGGEVISLMGSSDDVPVSAVRLDDSGPDHEFCSQLTLTNDQRAVPKGRYLLDVEGYLNSALRGYELYAKISPKTPLPSETWSADRLIYNEFTGEVPQNSYHLEGSGAVSFQLQNLEESCLELINDDPRAPFAFKDNNRECLAQLLDQGVYEYVYGYCPNSDASCIRNCGNGLVEGNEVCDDGNQIDNDSCTNNCTLNDYELERREALAPVAPANINIMQMYDDSVATIDLSVSGDTFTYYNKPYNRLTVSSNGFLMLDNNTDPQNLNSGCCSGSYLPQATPSKALIAAYWEDLLGRGDGANKWWIAGRELVVAWEGVDHYPGGAQVRVYVVLNLDGHAQEGEIRVICDACVSDGGAHTQGLQGEHPYQGLVPYGRNAVSWSEAGFEVLFRPLSSLP